jgi:Raf kinase inhibitor-like YbhB/YbcL family protein
MGKNSWGNTYYQGPCPPKGTHRYFFRIYALDINLNLLNPSKSEILNAMQNHFLDQDTLFATFKKK